MPTYAEQARQVEMDAKQQQEARRWYIGKIILGVLGCVAAIAGGILVSGVGVKNDALWGQVVSKVFDLRQGSCMPHMETIMDMYKPEVKYMRPRALKKLKGKARLGIKELPTLEEMLEKMTVADHIGQIVQPNVDEAGCNQMHDSKAGALFYAGHNSPGNDRASAWKHDVHSKQVNALNRKPHHLPIFIGVDTIHGMSHMLGATIFPHNLALGCTNNPALIEKVGRITALESNAVGVNWGFAPTVAVATDIRWGRIYESFGQDPDLVGRMGAAYITGANSVKDSHGSAFVTCAKHFVGDGGVQYGSGKVGSKIIDRGDFRSGLDELRNVHMKPYEYAIKAGVRSVMASYSSVDGIRMHARGDLINGELKERLGFKGFVSSDFMAVDDLDRDYDDAVAKAVNAGVDQIMLGGGQKGTNLHHVITKLVKKGEISKDRVKDAARRVLWAKYESGLMDKPHVDQGLSTEIVGSKEHRDINRQVAAESLVVLKNNKNIMPLQLSQKKLCVVGDASHNQGMQLGGWMGDWQGRSGHIMKECVTIKDGISSYAKSIGAADRVVFSKSGDDCGNSDVALLVIGEEPYAEFKGDRKRMPKPADLKLVAKMTKSNRTDVILLNIGGRPLDIETENEAASGVAVAFLPGSEGGHGIADVLFGKKAPKGKLSLDWPKSGHALVRNQEDRTLLYKYGDGLSWVLPAWSTSLKKKALSMKIKNAGEMFSKAV